MSRTSDNIRHIGYGGPGSGNYWSDSFRSVTGNYMLMSSGTFDQTYGNGSYDMVYNTVVNHTGTLGYRNGVSGIWYQATTVGSQYRIGAPGTDFRAGFDVEVLSRFYEFNKPAGQGGTPWMTAAESQLGVREATGNNDGADVVKYLKTTGLGSGYAWCSSFVNWSVKQAGIKGTSSASALSWNGWGQSLDDPAYGSIAKIDYGKGKGHVGFVAGVNSSGSIVLLGGNQSNMVRYSAFSPSSISGYVYPSGYSPSYTLPTLIINKAGGFGSTR